MLKKTLVFATTIFAMYSLAFGQDNAETYSSKMDEEYTTCTYAFEESEKIKLCYQMSLLEVCKDAEGVDHDSCLSAWKGNTYKFLIDADWAMPPEKQSAKDNFVSLEKSGYSKDNKSVHDFTIGCSGKNLFIAYETPFDMQDDSKVYGSFDRTGARVIDWRLTDDPRMIMIAGEEAADIFWEIGLEETFTMVTETQEGQIITQFKSGNYDDVSSNLAPCTDQE